METLQELRAWKDDPEFVENWRQVKRENKKRLAKLTYELTGIIIPIDSLYDVMVKRMHEYKRQLMNIFYVIHRYFMIKDLPANERANVVPRVVLIGGKAAPGYYNAKAVIKLINHVGAVVNNDA